MDSTTPALSGQPCCLPAVVVAGGSLAYPQVGVMHIVLSGPALLQASGTARVVAMQQGLVVLDSLSVDFNDDRSCVRFELPLACIQVGIVNIHVLFERSGSPSSHVHTAHLLALPPDEANEVSELFHAMTTEVASFFQTTGRAGFSQTALARLGGSFARWLSSSSRGTAPVVDGASSAVVDVPHMAACYAYDHFFTPFLHAWAALTQPTSTSPAAVAAERVRVLHGNPTPPAAASAADPECAAEQDDVSAPELISMYRHTINYMLDHDMYSCVVLLMNLLPELARTALVEGLQVPEPQCFSQMMESLSRAASRSCRSSNGGRSNGAGAESSDDERGPVMLRQLCVQQNERQARMAPLEQEQSQEPSADAVVAPVAPQRSIWPCSPVSFGRRQRQQLKAELARLDALFTGELALICVRRQPAHRLFTVGGLMAAVKVGGATPAAWPPRALCQPLCQPELEQQQPTSLQIRQKVVDQEFDACSSSQPPVPFYAPPRPLPPRRGLEACQPAASQSGVTVDAQTLQVSSGMLLRATLLGFPTPSTESLYTVFKSHYSNMLDMTAFIYSFGTFLTCFSKSSRSVPQMGCLLLYMACYFFPYAVMLANRTRYLHHREVLLTAGRSLSICVVGACALWFPAARPAAWVAAVQRTITLHISHGVILPGCQQVRFKYLLVIIAAHSFGDFGLLSIAMSHLHAAWSSAMIQATGLVVTLALDAWTRCVFLTRYQGVLRGGPSDGATSAVAAVRLAVPVPPLRARCSLKSD